MAYRIYWDQKLIKPTSFLEKLVLVKELKGIKQDYDCSRQNKFYPDSHFYRRQQLSPYKFMPTKIIYRKGQAGGRTRRKEMDQLKNNYGGALLELHNYVTLPTRL